MRHRLSESGDMILRTNLRRGCANGEGPLATTCRAITNAHDIELILMGPTIDAPREFLLRAIAGSGLSQTPEKSAQLPA